MSQICHVLSRGVDKRKIFLDDKDRFRFIHDLFEFNDEAPANTASYHFYQSGDLRYRQIAELERKERKPRKLLVNILAFCLMPNHYHLLLEQRAKNNIPKFMRKLNVGYVNYFNKKYDRQGTLFEGRYKSILLKTQSHFMYLPYYIHLNPLDLVMSSWREGKISGYKKAIEFLDSYRWSSHLDYMGQKNFPSVTQRNFLLSFFDGEKGYKSSLKNWLKDLDIEQFGDYILE